MGDLFHQKADRDIFFDSFANGLGSQLDQLRFEFEEIENKTSVAEPEDITEEATPPLTLESKVQEELERNIDNDEIDHQHKEHSKFYTMTIQRAFSTVSLMTNFKSNFWKRRHGKQSKRHDEAPERRNSMGAELETNNNHGIPQITVCEESEGRATIYSTVPRPPKNVWRSKTMSPSRGKSKKVVLDGVEQLDCGSSGNVYIPPVMIDGQKVHDYQYATPESSPVHKSADFRRKNSLSRLFRRRKSPKKSPNKEASQKPIKALYEKTVLTASNDAVNTCEANANGDTKPNGKSAHANGHSEAIKHQEIMGDDDVVNTCEANGATKPNGNYAHANGHSEVIKHEEIMNEDVQEAPIQL